MPWEPIRLSFSDQGHTSGLVPQDERVPRFVSLEDMGGTVPDPTKPTPYSPIYREAAAANGADFALERDAETRKAVVRPFFDPQTEREVAARILSSKEARLTEKVKRLREALDGARDIMELCRDAAEANTDASLGMRVPTLPQVQKYQAATKNYLDLMEKLEKEEARLFNYAVQDDVTAEAQARKEVQVKELLEQYGDHGPHYRMLVRLLASVGMRIDNMERAGKFEMAEFDQLAKLQVSVTNQLQKYTEATKSESISHQVNEVMQLVLAVVEADLYDMPSRWSTILGHIKRAVELGTTDILTTTPMLAAPKIIEGEAHEIGNQEG